MLGEKSIGDSITIIPAVNLHSLFSCWTICLLLILWWTTRKWPWFITYPSFQVPLEASLTNVDKMSLHCHLLNCDHKITAYPSHCGLCSNMLLTNRATQWWRLLGWRLPWPQQFFILFFIFDCNCLINHWSQKIKIKIVNSKLY